MEPDSIFLVVLVGLLAAGGIVGAVLLRPLAVKIGCGALTLVLAAAAGMAVVNDYYGYYQTWGQLRADLDGSYTSFHEAQAPRRHAGPVLAGRVESLALPGHDSHIDRPGLVYLPPQYFQRAYKHTDFPVVELLHGTPGDPGNWTVQLGIEQVLDTMISTHQIGPVIAVMPTMSVGRDFQECVNAPHALDDTYITRDVRHDVLVHFRASRVPAEWGVAGFSSGGYCAANLALRHRGDFGAAAAMDGYFRPGDGPAAAALHHKAAAELANDPLRTASRLRSGVHPLAAFWLSAGTGDTADFAAARAFTRALDGVEHVPLFREPGAVHNFQAWRAALQPMFGWLWAQLAPPQLRVDFPLAGRAHVSPRRSGQP